LEEGYDALFGHSETTHSLGLLVITCLAIVIRQGIAANPYSGMNEPPMFGDFEAQRHWMEITINLPIQDWYRQTADNDLQYWGLDYPPLTAYVSYLFGKIAEVFVPDLVALGESRGHESPEGKLFMRLSVQICDILIFFPAALLVACVSHRCSERKLERTKRAVTYMFLLLNPAFTLIDHGHFQYNCVAHGLSLAAAAMICARSSSYLLEGLGSCLFCLALLFKQMSLYYALAFFSFLLGRSLTFEPTYFRKLLRLACLGFSVISTFAIVLSPFLSPIEQLGHVVHRVFPVKRGIFEDKVANFWCATNLVIKWKEILSEKSDGSQPAVKVCAVLTLIGLLPFVIRAALFTRKQQTTDLLMTMGQCGLVFFLFSFQVHEKSILLPLLPFSALFVQAPLLVTTGSIVANATMFYLLRKDGLTIIYVVFQLSLTFIGMLYAVSSEFLVDCQALSWLCSRNLADIAIRTWFMISVGGVILAHVVDGAIDMFFRSRDVQLHLLFKKYPDIGAYMFVLIGAGFLMVVWSVMYLHSLVVCVKWLSSRKTKQKTA